MGLDAFEETADYNRLGFPYDPAVFKGKLIRFAHIDNISLEKMTVKDPVSYGIQIGYRLKVAHDKVGPHGWAEWLKRETDFSAAAASQVISVSGSVTSSPFRS